MFSPQKDMKELVLEILKKDQMSISGVCRELAERGVKLHRLELTGYLKALADMQVLKEKDIKPAKVFSVSASREKSLYELVGEISSTIGKNPDERATLAAYSLQRLFKRAVFDIEVARCGVGGSVEGRKATSEERAEAKAILTRMGYRVPNSDVPTVVEKDLEKHFVQVLAELVIERFNMRSHLKETTQLKL
ncbi:MAG: hypothetical protein A3K76_04395 [Euryarchaeota archaeon RBG_13_57_23]|nr:MAG: hypothetical protein A3K76_04395 [Euryarchaeota archaeon RBG_13_57_23]